MPISRLIRDVDDHQRWPPPMEPADVELAFYEKFFFSKDIEPYPVQEQAFEAIFKGENVMVTVPTGTGKTMMAKAALMRALYSRRTAIYTTPLRALTEEKYRELCEDFGGQYVGFATGDYKINPRAPIQVVVAEILWNYIYGAKKRVPADVVVMDETHYFNDHERGYVWEESIIGLAPPVQLILLSATIGNPQQFCQWIYLVRGTPITLVESYERRVPLFHEYEEKYLKEKIKELYDNGEYPAIIFVFSRKDCFEYAKLIKSLPRFTTDEERAEIKRRAEEVIIPRGIGNKLLSFLLHGIGIHHAGILPAYKRLIEELTLDKLLKFIVSTETISAGINLPAKRVVFPSLRKRVRNQARLLTSAEYHQMAGRAGRPQFDKEGIAITLAPEEVVQEFRKELRQAQKSGRKFDPEMIKRKAYSRFRTKAQMEGDVFWDREVHKKLVEGKHAPLVSHTKLTAEQVLAIGLPDLTERELPGRKLVEAELERKRRQEEKRQKFLAQVKGEEPEQTTSSGLSFAHQLQSLRDSLPSLEDENDGSSESSEVDTGEGTPTTDGPETSDTTPNQFTTGSDTVSPESTEQSDGSGSFDADDTEKIRVSDTSERTEATEVEVPPGEVKIIEGIGSLPSRSKEEKLPAGEAKPEELPLIRDSIDKKIARGEVGEGKDFSNSPLPPPLVSYPTLPLPKDELNILDVIDKLFVPDNERKKFHKELVKIIDNLKALGVIDERGVQVRGWMINHLRGFDGVFVYYALMSREFNYPECIQMVEFLIDHDVIQRKLDKKEEDKKKEWIREKLRELRRSGVQVDWATLELEYEKKHPRPTTFIESIHEEFLSILPHPELHRGKRPKSIWWIMESKQLSFMDFVERYKIEEEEGNLFTYLARIIKTAKLLFEVTGISEFYHLQMKVMSRLAAVDERIVENYWGTFSRSPQLGLPLHLQEFPHTAESDEGPSTEEDDALGEPLDSEENGEEEKSAEASKNPEDSEGPESSESNGE